MTNEEWISQYPEDWHEASEVNKYSPNEYDFTWNETHTHFRLKRLQWNDQSSYIRFQGDYE